MLSYLFAAWRALSTVTGSFRPEVVHCFFGIPTGLLCTHPALRRVPWVLSVRGSDVPGHSPDISRAVYWAVTPVVRRVWRAMDAVVCNSESLRQEVLAISPDLPVEVIGNGIDTERFAPRAGAPNGAPRTVLFVGRLNPLKRVDLMIRALASPRLGGRSVRLRIVGEGVSGPSLRRLAQDLGVGERVDFVGEVAFDLIDAEYRKADLYCQLSAIEGMSNTLVEAMASGLPVISSTAGNARGLVDGNGFLVENPTADGVAEILARYLDAPQLVTEHGARSRALASALGFESAAARYLGVLERCLSSAER
jgi:glycosyltransferase involved in cell wall biosynthesis